MLWAKEEKTTLVGSVQNKEEMKVIEYPFLKLDIEIPINFFFQIPGCDIY